MSAVPRKVKTKIRPPRKHGPDTSLSDTWASLSRAITEIHSHNAAHLSFEENYRFAYNLVLHKQGRMLYDGVKALITKNVVRLRDELVRPAFPSANAGGGTGAGAGVAGDPATRSQEAERFLKALRESWDDHVSSMSKLRDILKYMDRIYTPSAGVPVIWDAGMQLYLTEMISSPVKEHIVDAVLNQIQMEREGFAVNRSAVKSAVDVLLTLKEERDTGSISVYARDVEPEVLQTSRTFYKEEGDRLLHSCGSPEFLKRVEDRFSQEETRAIHYLSTHTANPLRLILEETLLTPHLTSIISKPNSGLENMLDLNKKDDLARLYRLFKMVTEGISTLKQALKASVRTRGTEINVMYAEDVTRRTEGALPTEAGSEEKEKEKEKKGKTQNGVAANADAATKWVEGVLSLKDLFDRVWKQCFSSDHQIETTLNESFQTFINRNPRSPEYISLFIDENLKKGLKGKTDEEVDAVLDKTITIFRYIADKDVFERYYKAHLAKRLLQNRSVSDDAERNMIAKLKVECGFHFTQKLEGMFTDMKISADTMLAYKKHLETSTTVPELEISVTIMTSHKWPNTLTLNPPTCTLPNAMLKASRAFEMYYRSQHTGRRLTWQLGLGNADVKVAFKNKKHDLNVSTLALVVLLLFEDVADGEFLTYEEIKSATELADPELKRQLQSLACAKFKVLKKHPPSREVNDDDSFSFNADFSAPMQKIKISTVASGTKAENPEERRETQERIDEERKHQTDACIVRIMKDRKHMTHNELINEVTRQLSARFLPQPSSIKRRIENLIEREYLERCDDKKSYNYLA